MRALVVIPTYQEADNVATLLARLRAAAPGADVLVVDDASPDGTAERAEKAGADLGGITVLRRPGKSGLGTAYRDGFQRGLDEGYDVLASMDADLSHDPAALPSLLAAVDAGADLAIGSRYVEGGAIPDWPLHRRALSRYGNRYAAAMLRVGLADMTSGYRAYRATILQAFGLGMVETGGYGALIELAYRVCAAGGAVTEVPITFVDRRLGESKMSAAGAVETFFFVTRIGLRARLRAG